MLVRLFTEDKNYDAVVKIVGRYFNNFSVLPYKGYWLGKPEPALCIEIDMLNAPPNWLARVKCIASEIKTINKQQTVLLQKIQTQTEIL